MIRLLFLIVVCLPSMVFGYSINELPSLVKKVSPSVVNISTIRKARSDNAVDPMLEEFEGTPFYEFFKRFWGMPGPSDRPEYDLRSLGSGFVIDASGYIVTNNHVIKDADEILVRFSDHQEFPATLIGSDEESDTALLKIDAQNLPVLELATKTPEVGEWVIAVGSPFGFDHSVTSGIVSAIERSFDKERYVPFIQTDVAINPGNSGGPLINLDGKVVGVNSHIVTRSGQYGGLSFAIPSDIVKTVTSQLQSKGKVVRGWLGLTFQPITRELAQSFGLKRPRGALISEVMKDAPAAKAGLKRGDIILRFDNHEIDSAENLPHFVGRVTPGATVKLEVFRNKKTIDIPVTIGLLPDKEEKAQATPTNAASNLLGLKLRALSKDEKKQTGLKEGLVIEKVTRGPLAQTGIQTGDILLLINQKSMDSMKDFDEALENLNPKDLVSLLIARPGLGQRYIAIRLPDEKK